MTKFKASLGCLARLSQQSKTIQEEIISPGDRGLPVELLYEQSAPHYWKMSRGPRTEQLGFICYEWLQK